MPKGRVLKTICWSNMPKFVPNNIESKNLFWSLKSNFFKKKLILNFFIVIKNIIAPSNLISVVWKGDRLLSKNTFRDNRPPKTAHETDKNGNVLGVYDGTNEARMKDLINDIKVLMAEYKRPTKNEI